MLHEPQVVKPHLVGQLTLFESLLVKRVPVDLGALEGALAFVKQAELHGKSPVLRNRGAARFRLVAAGFATKDHPGALDECWRQYSVIATCWRTMRASARFRADQRGARSHAW